MTRDNYSCYGHVVKKPRYVVKKRRYHPYRGKYQRENHSVRLFHIQTRALQWSCRIRREATHVSTGIIYNMQYGSGKTLLALAFALRYREQILYLCPPNVVGHVLQQIAIHFKGSISAYEAKKWDPIQFSTHRVIVMSYYTLGRLDPNAILTWNFTFSTCIIDELEYCISKKKVGLMLNKVILARFYIGLTGANQVTSDMLRFVKCKSKRSVFIHRRIQNYSLQTHLLDLDETQRKDYKQQAKKVSLRSDNFASNQKLISVREHVSLYKVHHIIFLLTRCMNMKVLVVTEFTKTLNHLFSMLKHHKQPTCIITAATHALKEDRTKAIENFQNIPTLNIMLADTDLITYGIDLGFVDVMIVVDLPIKVDVYRQLQGRITRIGQRAMNVEQQQVFELVAKDTCDELVYNDIHNTKRYRI